MTLETRVWLGKKGRFHSVQDVLTGVLRLDGERLTFRGDQGTALETTVSESDPRFPTSLTGIGLTLFVRGRKLFVWFDDPYARNALREATRRA
ncbi:MAG TPA: hypothetical protein VGQ38_03435 [Gaiellaceae bacterium]|jgi:hypothetical protein|nr:hypothetical protein [Gaiellaceae bacterium]